MTRSGTCDYSCPLSPCLSPSLPPSLSFQLISTLDGNEYVTPSQLEKELRDEIVVAGGRLKLTDIQPQLNVDLGHIHRRMDDILTEDPSIKLIDGEVITEDYFDGISEEINQILQEAGSLRLVELASRFSISTQMLSDALKSRLGPIVQGRMESGMLFTNTYVERQEACIRGAFSGLTRPMAVAELQAAFDFDESLFEPTVEALLKSGRLKGALAGKGMRATYTPAVFSALQIKAVNDFFKSNGYIEFATAERMRISNPKGFLTKELGGAGFALRSSFCGHSLVDAVDVQIEEALSSGTILDVAPLLPPFMDEQDQAAIIGRCASVTKGKTAHKLMAQSLIVPQVFLAKCSEHIALAAKRDADRLGKELAEEVRAERRGEEAGDDCGGRGKKARGGNKGRGRDAEEEEEEEEELKKKKGASKRELQKEEALKGKGGKASKIAKEKDERAAGKGGGKGGAGAAGKTGGFDFEGETKRLVIEFLRAAAGDEGGALAGNEDFVDEIVGTVRSGARAAMMEAASSLFSSGAQRRAKREALQTKFVGLYQQLCMFRKGVTLFGEDQQAALEKFLLRSVCADIVNLVLAEHAADGVEGDAAPPAIITAEDRARVLASLPATTQKDLSGLVEALHHNKTTAQFEAALQAAASGAGIECKPMDKNMERGAVHATRQQWQAQIKTEVQPPVVLVLSLQLLVLHLHKVLVTLPGRAIAPVLKHLEASLTPAAVDTLNSLHQRVVRILEVDDPAEAAALSAQAQPDVAEVRALASSKDGLEKACAAE